MRSDLRKEGACLSSQDFELVKQVRFTLKSASLDCLDTLSDQVEVPISPRAIEEAYGMRMTTIRNPLECSICSVKFYEGDILRQLPCSNAHVFHSPCVREWLLTKSGNCPTCRLDSRLYVEDQSNRTISAASRNSESDKGVIISKKMTSLPRRRLSSLEHSKGIHHDGDWVTPQSRGNYLDSTDSDCDDDAEDNWWREQRREQQEISVAVVYKSSKKGRRGRYGHGLVVAETSVGDGSRLTVGRQGRRRKAEARGGTDRGASSSRCGKGSSSSSSNGGGGGTSSGIGNTNLRNRIQQLRSLPTGYGTSMKTSSKVHEVDNLKQGVRKRQGGGRVSTVRATADDPFSSLSSSSRLSPGTVLKAPTQRTLQKRSSRVVVPAGGRRVHRQSSYSVLQP